MGRYYSGVRKLDFSDSRASLIAGSPRLGELIYAHPVRSTSDSVPHWWGYHVTQFQRPIDHSIAMSPLYVGNVQASFGRFSRDGESFLREVFTPQEREWIWSQMTTSSETGYRLHGYQQIAGLLGIKLGILISLGWTHPLPLGSVQFEVTDGALTRVGLRHEVESRAISAGIDPATGLVRIADCGNLSMGMAIFARQGERLPFHGFGLALVNPRVRRSPAAAAVGKSIAKALSAEIRAPSNKSISREMERANEAAESAAVQEVLPPDGEIGEITLPSGAGRAAILHYLYSEMAIAFATVANP